MPDNPPVLLDPHTAQRQAFQRVTRAVTSGLPARDVLRLITEEACALTASANVAVGLRADTGTLLEFRAVAGENAGEVMGLRVHIDDSLGEAALRTGLPLLFGGQGDSEPRGALVVPVSRDGKVVGALFAHRKPESAPYTEDDAALLGMLADCVALALANDEAVRSSREQSRELAVIYDAVQRVSGSLNVQEVMDSVLDAVCQYLEHQAAVLFLLNDERTHLFIAADRGLNDDDREIQLAADGRVTADVLDSGEPLLLHDTGAEPEFDNILTQGRTRSAMIAPIRSRNDTLGLVIVTSAQPDAYTFNDLKMLSAVAMQAGVAISNAWLYEDATRRAEEASALYDLSQHVNSTLHLDRVFPFIADSVLNLLKVDKFALMLYDEREQRLVTRISLGVDPDTFGRVRPRLGEGIAGWVLEWMTPTAVADVAADARDRSAPISSYGVVSTICVPITMGEEVIGVMLAMSSTRRLFTVAEMELLYTISNQAGVAIANAMLYQDARARSMEMRRYIHRIARALGSALEVQDMPHLLADVAIEVMRADRCAVYRVEGEMVKLHATCGFRPSTPPDPELPVGEGLTGWVARRGQALTIESLADDARAGAHAWLSRDRLSSYLAVPLKVGRRTVGVVEIYTNEPRVFTEDEIKLLNQFARRARVAERMA